MAQVTYGDSAPSVPNVQIVISNPATQGTITGTVQRAGDGVSGIGGSPTVVVANAKVLLSATAPSSAKFAFTNLGAIVAYTNGSGVFTIPNVPAATNYTLVASYSGQTNATAQGVTVTAGQTITRNFTLAKAAVGTSNLPAVANFDGLSITTPINPTRAAGASSIDSGVLAVRDYLLRKRGILARRAASPSRVITKTVRPTRAAPNGYVIQNILEWDYQAYDTLYGYAVLLSQNNTDNFVTIANIQDPLAERFSDGDPTLTPNLLYYYNIVRVDVNQNEGSVTGENTVVLRPLDPINPTAPASGSTQSSPTFRWQAVTNAINYTIVVYDQYPSPVDPNIQNIQAGPPIPVQPIWTQNVTNATSLAYGGPALTSGHRYYWAVAADDQQTTDAINYDTTISALSNFIAP